MEVTEEMEKETVEVLKSLGLEISDIQLTFQWLSDQISDSNYKITQTEKIKLIIGRIEMGSKKFNAIIALFALQDMEKLMEDCTREQLKKELPEISKDLPEAMKVSTDVISRMTAIAEKMLNDPNIVMSDEDRKRGEEVVRRGKGLI